MHEDEDQKVEKGTFPTFTTYFSNSSIDHYDSAQIAAPFSIDFRTLWAETFSSLAMAAAEIPRPRGVKLKL